MGPDKVVGEYNPERGPGLVPGPPHGTQQTAALGGHALGGQAGRHRPLHPPGRLQIEGPPPGGGDNQMNTAYLN